MYMLKSEQLSSIAVDSGSLDTVITVTVLHACTTVLLPRTYLNTGFTNREETFILVLINDKIKRFSGNPRPPSHQTRSQH